MAAYADVLVKAIGVTQTAIQDGIAASLDFKKWAAGYGKNAVDAAKPSSEPLSTAQQGVLIGGMIGVLGGPVGVVIGGVIGGVIGKALETDTKPGSAVPAAGAPQGNWGKAYPGKAKGGISSGSLGGYQELLHGTEAVVPLPDGKSIPVSLDSSSLNATMQQQTMILGGILAAMNKNNHLSSGILQNSY